MNFLIFLVSLARSIHTCSVNMRVSLTSIPLLYVSEPDPKLFGPKDSQGCLDWTIGDLDHKVSLEQSLTRRNVPVEEAWKDLLET